MGCSQSDKRILAEEDLNKKRYEEKKIKEKKVKSIDAKKLMTIKFQSDDGNINYILSCNENDIFKDITNKLFEEKKEFKEYGNTFLCNGNNINENKSLKENTIKNNDIIIVKEDINKKEEKKLQNLAEKLKKETLLNVIICTKDTKNLIILNFYSNDEKIHCLLICNEVQIFNEIINKVYETYSDYNIRNNYFICNKSRVNEYKSLKENNIKNKDLIILIKFTQNCVNAFFVKFKKREEEYELDSLAKKLKEETNIDVIVSAKDTKNIITLKFQSVDQNINYFVICNEDEIFNIVVNKIFEVKKVFKEYGNIFLCNSNTINEYKSLKENNLKNNDIIIVNKLESDDDDTGNEKEIEEKKLKKLAERIKKKTNIDVIISAKDTKNLITIRMICNFNQDIDYYILCDENDIFNSILNKIFKLKSIFKELKLAYVCNTNGRLINEYKSLKENEIKDESIIFMNTEREISYLVSENNNNNDNNGIYLMAEILKEETKIDVVISAKNNIDLITIKFQSVDQNVNCFALCNEKDIFNSVVNKVFEKKPEFMQKGNVFLCKGNRVNVYKSLWENNIQDGDRIILYEFNDDE